MLKLVLPCVRCELKTPQAKAVVDMMLSWGTRPELACMMCPCGRSTCVSLARKTTCRGPVEARPRARELDRRRTTRVPSGPLDVTPSFAEEFLQLGLTSDPRAGKRRAFRKRSLLLARRRRLDRGSDRVYHRQRRGRFLLAR